MLARRASFRCYSGVRFGGTLTIEDAWHTPSGYVHFLADVDVLLIASAS